MIKEKKIGLIIPAYNEEKLISTTLSSVPTYIDSIVCIDDGSIDRTAQKIKLFQKKDKRVIFLKHEKNGGVGSAVKDGIKRLFSEKVDYMVIAAGDNQCDLSKIKDFIICCEEENIDVCRGNRFLNLSELSQMPTLRLVGNAVYSFVTKFVSGYYSLFDFQSSYSAIRSNILSKINIDSLRDDYLFDNSLWVNLNIANARIKEISIPIVYKNEISNINYFTFVKRSFGYLTKAFLTRILHKYILVLHPIGLFFFAGFLLFMFGLLFGFYVLIHIIGPETATTATVMLSVLPFLIGFQLLLQAVVLDIQNEPH